MTNRQWPLKLRNLVPLIPTNDLIYSFYTLFIAVLRHLLVTASVHARKTNYRRSTNFLLFVLLHNTVKSMKIHRYEVNLCYTYNTHYMTHILMSITINAYNEHLCKMTLIFHIGIINDVL